MIENCNDQTLWFQPTQYLNIAIIQKFVFKQCSDHYLFTMYILKPYNVIICIDILLKMGYLCRITSIAENKAVHKEKEKFESELL